MHFFNESEWRVDDRKTRRGQPVSILARGRDVDTHAHETRDSAGQKLIAKEVACSRGFSRKPRKIDAGRKAPVGSAKNPRAIVEFALGLEWRIDKDESSAFLWRQHSRQQVVTVAAHDFGG